MTKRNQAVTLVRNSRGQISIFFSASLIVLITIVAFVINIGLFVKAKINLQNATDAAAYSGAAVQARQLSTIGYLNWEMRNIYKEWMYKYYVVGNLNIRDVEEGSKNAAMSFRLDAARNPLESGALASVEDPFNIPAVCIHVESSRTNICRQYDVPGLPEFGSSGLPGAEQASRAFQDALISNKVLDCAQRTTLNSLVTTTWAYNVLTTENLDQTLIGRGPAVLANRQGAWPRAVELAMRIRNLELAVNRPPETSRVCNAGSTFASLTNCSRSIQDISGERRLGNERIVKAFYSGYRNLGNNVDNEMKESFTLTEIPPQEADLGGKTSASYLLIPEDRVANYKKQYLDLKLMMINVATFYGAMIPAADRSTSGACVISKIAIPVPGYPLGYYKNPDLLTYYAVKGEAEFVGMFNPFSSDAIKLTTYSAAKPFGGRIGPMLFSQTRDFVTGRNDAGKFRSVPYLSSLEFVGTKVRFFFERAIRELKLGEYVQGVPMPFNDVGGSDGYFWVEDSDKPVGGLITDGTIQFGLPNMVYDYQEAFRDTGYTVANASIHKIKTAEPKTADEAVGLFSSAQFKAFKGTRIGNELTTQQLMEEEISRIRAPTLYEAANYLVPTPNDFNTRNALDSFGFISGTPRQLPGGVKEYTSYVYAPLHSEDQVDVLWRNPSEVISTIFEFLRAQKPGIDKYRRSMNVAARKIAQVANQVQGTIAANSAKGYVDAAKKIANIDFANPSNDQPVADCDNLLGSFLYFYYGAANLYPSEYVSTTTGCPTPLGDQLRTYFSQSDSDSGFRTSHYQFVYSWKEDNFPLAPHGPSKAMSVLSAYQPGPFTGVALGGQFVNPITDEPLELMRRNFYSTKFVALDSLQNGGGYSQAQTNFVIYSEGTPEGDTGEGSQTSFKNSLNAEAVGLDLSAIKY